MALGTVQEGGATFLSIAGGFIWNRKADSSDPNYAEQTYAKQDKTEGVRKGARYADLSGLIVKVEFKTHAEFGENINITFEADQEIYIISITTNNRYSQDMMKALLTMDTSKEIYMKPYDFMDSKKKRAQGISFRQDGEKLDLKVDNAPQKDVDWFKSADKKSIKRFFEDLNDWYVGEIEEKVVPNFKDLEALPKKEKSEAKIETKVETKVKEPTKKVEEKSVEEKEPLSATPLKMKKALKEYIGENYPGNELPALEKEELIKWYNLCIAEEELPWEETTKEKDVAEVSESDIDSQLDALLS